jgi:hypothetical protein
MRTAQFLAVDAAADKYANLSRKPNNDKNVLACKKKLLRAHVSSYFLPFKMTNRQNWMCQHRMGFNLESTLQ